MSKVYQTARFGRLERDAVEKHLQLQGRARSHSVPGKIERALGMLRSWEKRVMVNTVATVCDIGVPAPQCAPEQKANENG